MEPKQDSLEVGSSGLLGFLRPRKWKRRDVLHRPHEYGFTVEEAQSKVREPCQICGRAVPVVFDHDHKNEDFRGMLCARCNTMIGFGWDLPWVFLNAAGYLMNHQAEHESDPVEKLSILGTRMKIEMARIRVDSLTQDETELLKSEIRNLLDTSLGWAFWAAARNADPAENERWTDFIGKAVARYEHHFGTSPRVLVDPDFASEWDVLAGARA